MKHASKIIFLCVYTLLFSALIYVGKEIFFPSRITEEMHIEPGFHMQYQKFSEDEFSDFDMSDTENIEQVVHRLIYEEFRKKYEESLGEKIDIRFIPTSLQEHIKSSYLPLVEVFLYDNIFFPKIRDLKVLLYQNMADTRGRMRGGNIHMYGVPKLSDEEFLSVLVHEFSHYYDIYSLAGNAFGDISHKFYNISWKSATQMKADQTIENFVSGYAVTNQYEDFAETYTYYIFHNEDFLRRSKTNPYLKKKYNFFSDYVFVSGEFSDVHFGLEDTKEIDYFWDTTKLEIDVKKFLQYLSDGI